MKLRLLIRPDCNRKCPGCCNKQWYVVLSNANHRIDQYRLAFEMGDFDGK